MILRNLLVSQDDLELLIGFRPAPIFVAALIALLAALGLLGEGGNPEVVYSILPGVALGIMGGMAALGVAGTAISAHQAGKAAKEAAKPTSGETALAQEIREVQTGVDAAEVDAMISQAAVPIGAQTAAMQQDVSQGALTQTGGGGEPGVALAGREAAVLTQIARQGSEGMADVSLGARKIGEEKAAIQQGREDALRGMLVGTQDAREGRVAGLKAQQAGAWGQAGSAMLGGTATGMTTGLASSIPITPPTTPTG